MTNTCVINRRPATNQDIPLNIGCIVEEGTSYDITNGDMMCNTLDCTNVIKYKQPYCASDDVLCPGRYKERMDSGTNTNSGTNDTNDTNTNSGISGISMKPLTGMQLLIFMVVVILFLALLVGPQSVVSKLKGGFPPCLRDETYTYL